MRQLVLTVPQAARLARKNPETIRRWIREGRLRARKVGTQHVIEEQDLDEVLGALDEVLPLPRSWSGKTLTGEPMPNWVSAVRHQRDHH